MNLGLPDYAGDSSLSLTNIHHLTGHDLRMSKGDGIMYDQNLIVQKALHQVPQGHLSPSSLLKSSGKLVTLRRKQHSVLRLLKGSLRCCLLTKHISNDLWE
jgi:hypothetical protein